MGTSGLEPPTSRLSGVRSNHLSYAPIHYALLSRAFLWSTTAVRPHSLVGGDEEDRTPDPLRARQVLSQLSYTPMIKGLGFSVFVPLFEDAFGTLKIE